MAKSKPSDLEKLEQELIDIEKKLLEAQQELVLQDRALIVAIKLLQTAIADSEHFGAFLDSPRLHAGLAEIRPKLHYLADGKDVAKGVAEAGQDLGAFIASEIQNFTKAVQDTIMTRLREGRNATS